jgi:hypothetical protein
VNPWKYIALIAEVIVQRTKTAYYFLAVLRGEGNRLSPRTVAWREDNFNTREDFSVAIDSSKI